MEGLNLGFITTDQDPEIEKETVSTALINGNHKFGHVVTYRAMELAIKKHVKLVLDLWEFTIQTISVQQVTTRIWH